MIDLDEQQVGGNWLRTLTVEPHPVISGLPDDTPPLGVEAFLAMRNRLSESSPEPAIEVWKHALRKLLQEQHPRIATEQARPHTFYVTETDLPIDFERPEHWGGLVQYWMRPLLPPDNDAQVQALVAEVDAVEAEAREEGFPCPSVQARSNAKQLLNGIARIYHHDIDIYPTPDGEVAIDLSGGYRRSVLVFCDADGGALCMVSLMGVHRRAHYDEAPTQPDGFMREAIAELQQSA